MPVPKVGEQPRYVAAAAAAEVRRDPLGRGPRSPHRGCGASGLGVSAASRRPPHQARRESQTDNRGSHGRGQHSDAVTEVARSGQLKPACQGSKARLRSGMAAPIAAGRRAAGRGLEPTPTASMPAPMGSPH
jgi:hypothetical protein